MIHIAVPVVTVQSVWFSTVVSHDSHSSARGYSTICGSVQWLAMIHIAVPVVTVQSVWFSTVVSHDSHSSASRYSTICVVQYSG